MTSPILPVEVTCRRCFTKWTAYVRDSINRRLDPDLEPPPAPKCPSCGLVIAVETLYFDEPERDR